MKQLVRLWNRPSRDGTRFTCVLIYPDEQGKTKYESLGHADSRKAERQRAQKQRELQMGIVEVGSMRLSELLEDYLQRTRTQIEVSTANSAVYRMRDFIAAVGNKYADTITYCDCERLQQYCIDRGLSPASVNTHIKMLRRVFSLAVKRGQLEKNPFNGLPYLKVPRKPVRLVNTNEFQRILNAAPDLLWKARILVAKTTALRRGEILNLTVNDLDFSQGKIFVQPKADSEHTWRWVVKDKDRRELPLIREVAEMLIGIYESLPEGQPYLLLPPERYQMLLDLHKAGKLLDRVKKCPDQNIWRNWQVICKHANISDIAFHDLRATCITEWFEQGMMPHEVQRLAGHSSIETTMCYYVGYRDTLTDRAREASCAALGDDFVARLLRAPQNGPLAQKQVAPSVPQHLDTTGFAKIGATGLEPATS